MKKTLTLKEKIIVASTLFGMFFGAGNLIFPVHLGQMAGSNSWPAIIGFVVTAVGIPILGVAAIGNTHSDNLLEMSSKVSRGYGVVFTSLLYLTIGPFFAISRCATTSFTTGFAPMVGEDKVVIGQLIFSAIFFAIVLACSWSPRKISLYVGKVINPIFLLFLGILVVVALLNPSANMADVAPVENYQTGAFFNGFIEGYGTMDAIAGLAFGIVIIEVVRSLGITDDDCVAKETVKSGVFTAILMGLIYVVTIIMGAQSRGLFEVSENGGIALAQISNHYLGSVGSIVLAATITLACLKTAIGLVTSCAEMFVKMFHRPFNYRGWALVFTLFSFVVSNVGLTAIINYSIPVLMLLYPLTITIIILALCEKLFGKKRSVYVCVTIFAAIAAIFDFLKTMPEGFQNALNIPALTEKISGFLPFFDLGLGWIVPSLIGLVLGVILGLFSKKDKAAA